MKSLAVSDRKKRLYLEKFFNTINVRNDALIQIKKKYYRIIKRIG